MTLGGLEQGSKSADFLRAEFLIDKNEYPKLSLFFSGLLMKTTLTEVEVAIKKYGFTINKEGKTWVVKNGDQEIVNLHLR